MIGTVASSLDEESLVRFFHSHAIDEFVVVSPSAISAPPGRRPADLFPACRTMILFGKVMGDDLFFGNVPETAPRITVFKQELARVSDELVRVLQESGSAATAVNSVIVKDGKLKWSLSLKHCARDAGLGEIGDNGLLLSPRFGIRLGLGAVLTDQEIPAVKPSPDPVKICTHCGLCIRACPVNALDNGDMDSFRCLNISGALPAPVVSLFVRLMGTKSLVPLLTTIANRVAARSAARCSACLMACPLFKKYGGK
ncbi:MAG: 4Fe-4S binding protein [Methanoregula sp.]|nr:4Fe-4S binding protein [Methanoregula sp.]